MQVGTVLKIPSNVGTNPDNMFMYTVKSGDSLYSIARRYNTTVDEIMKLNYFDTTNLKVGQVIRIPEMFTPDDEMYLPEFINYTVKKGDSLYNIAKQYNISVNDLIKDNNLNNSKLSIGQVLKIPKDSYNSNVTYIVKKGDSLYSIAKKYNTTVDSIKNKNNLKSNSLSIGQQLYI